MQLTQQTLDVLKNFSTINQGILIKEGKEISTISVAKDVLAKATVDVEFPKDFAIYDLNEFLSTLSMFDNPELDFEENYVKISQGRSKVSYYYSSPTVIIAPPEEANFPDGDIEFDMDNAEIESVKKAASIMKLDLLTFESEGEKVKCIVNDNTSSTNNNYEIVLDGVTEEFSASMRILNLNLLPSNYKVNVTLDSYIRFYNDNISYWIGIEE